MSSPPSLKRCAEGRSQLETMPRIIGGRYGLSSKEFTPAMVKAVFDELAKPQPKNHFTIGIHDDVTHTSLAYDPDFSTKSRAQVAHCSTDWVPTARSAPTRTPSRSSVTNTPNYAQGYFVYDSKKSGAMTMSHLRFGPDPIRSTYLITKANFVACHQFSFLERYGCSRALPHRAHFPAQFPLQCGQKSGSMFRAQRRQQIIEKQLKFYVIDGYKVAQDAGMGNRINTIMQTCFFAISGVLPRDEAIEKIKKSIQKTYGKRGEAVVRQNFAAVDAASGSSHEVQVPAQASQPTSKFCPQFLPELPHSSATYSA